MSEAPISDSPRSWLRDFGRVEAAIFYHHAMATHMVDENNFLDPEIWQIHLSKMEDSPQSKAIREWLKRSRLYAKQNGMIEEFDEVLGDIFGSALR